MKTWKSIVAIVLIFCLGTLTGGLVVAGIAKNRVEHFIRVGAPEAGPMIVRRLTGRLNLDAAQKQKLETIVNGGQSRLRAIRARVEPEVKEVIGETTGEIRVILNPAQQEKFDQIIKDAEKRLGPLKE